MGRRRVITRRKEGRVAGVVGLIVIFGDSGFLESSVESSS